MQKRLVMGMGTLAIAAAVVVGSLEWMSAEAARTQLEGVETAPVSAEPAPRRTAPVRVQQVAERFGEAAPRVDSSVQSFRRMRASMGPAAGS
ncbi:MAG: hypothetical protein ACQGVK_08465 [Myxococcota bacterium]